MSHAPDRPFAAVPDPTDRWCVYLVRCRDGALYCGITNNPRWRFAQHQTGQGAAFTRIRGAEEMRVILCCLSRSQALKAEYAVKKCKRADKLTLWATGKIIATASRPEKP